MSSSGTPTRWDGMSAKMRGSCFPASRSGRGRGSSTSPRSWRTHRHTNHIWNISHLSAYNGSLLYFHVYPPASCCACVSCVCVCFDAPPGSVCCVGTPPGRCAARWPPGSPAWSAESSLVPLETHSQPSSHPDPAADWPSIPAAHTHTQRTEVSYEKWLPTLNFQFEHSNLI